MSMPTKNKSSNTKSRFYERDTLGDLAGRIDSKSRNFAQKLHKWQGTYLFYAGLDGTSVSYSTLKATFDAIFANSKKSSSDAMHEWMMTPAGIAITAVESISIISFSLLGNYFKEDEGHKFTQGIAKVWPYVRDVMKGAKNSQKGVKSALQITHLLAGLDVNFLMLPLSFSLGGVAILNRLWFRYMYTERKRMMDVNTALIAELDGLETLSVEKCREKRAAMLEYGTQSTTVRIAAMFSALYAGMIDSLYLYVGVLSLCAFTWPALVVMTVFCAIYSAGCVLSRLYEEYNYQRKLLITHAKIELALYSKEHAFEMQNSFTRLQKISKLLAMGEQSEDLLAEQDLLAKNILEKIKNFTEKRNHLQSLMTLSYTSAFMAGVVNGLSAYRALSSGMFACATVFFLTSTSFPPALLIACVSAGMALLIGFIAHSMINNYWHRAKLVEENSQPYDRLSHVLQVLKDVHLNKVDDISEEEVQQVIERGQKIISPPKFYYEQWFEVLRSFFSGPAKGSKFIDYTLNPLQEADEHGHYHDTPLMLVLAFFSAVAHSLILAGRALAKGFNSDDKKASNNLATQCKQADTLSEEPESSASLVESFRSDSCIIADNNLSDEDNAGSGHDDACSAPVVLSGASSESDTPAPKIQPRPSPLVNFTFFRHSLENPPQKSCNQQENVLSDFGRTSLAQVM